MKPTLTVPNPASPTRTRPAQLITDRAKRYRANASPPPGPRRCNYCRVQSKHVDIDHIDGREENGAPANLIYACRSCNTAKGLLFSRHNIGRRAVRYNPSNPGAESLKQWVWAAETVTGKIPGTAAEIRQAASIISHTPASERSEFAREIWVRRRAHGTAGRSKVPF